MDDSQCTEDQPDTRRVCRLDPCPDGSNAHGMVQVEVGSCMLSSGGGGFFLACWDFVVRLDESFPVCAFFFKSRYELAHSNFSL